MHLPKKTRHPLKPRLKPRLLYSPQCSVQTSPSRRGKNGHEELPSSRRAFSARSDRAIHGSRIGKHSARARTQEPGTRSYYSSAQAPLAGSKKGARAHSFRGLRSSLIEILTRERVCCALKLALESCGHLRSRLASTSQRGQGLIVVRMNDRRMHFAGSFFGLCLT